MQTGQTKSPVKIKALKKFEKLLHLECILQSTAQGTEDRRFFGLKKKDLLAFGV